MKSRAADLIHYFDVLQRDPPVPRGTDDSEDGPSTRRRHARGLEYLHRLFSGSAARGNLYA